MIHWGCATKHGSTYKLNSVVRGVLEGGCGKEVVDLGRVSLVIGLGVADNGALEGVETLEAQ